MIDRVLLEKIREYHPADAMDQENILQELMQHYILASLSKAGFFKTAVFHGGTCLRILNGMNRFSEDLDFISKKPDPDFLWGVSLLKRIQEDCESDGIQFECLDKSEKGTVKKAFLKTDSIGKIILLELPFTRRKTRKIKIKLEIDTNPPAGSLWETAYLNFPKIAPVTAMTLDSGFASKCHALLCRIYIKGRDWYDFWWYVNRKAGINFTLLKNALRQMGPWERKNIDVTPAWLIANMKKRISEIDWNRAREDVRRFLPLEEQPALDHWNREFFLYLANQLWARLQS